MTTEYADNVVELDTLDDSASIPFPLYIDPTADPAFADGQVRGQFKVAENGAIIYLKEKSDYRIAVQRLLWVDGWRNKDEKVPEEMTLVVLKFTFHSTARSDDTTKLGTVNASMSFLDEDQKRQSDPEVVAWAPFRDLKKWNSSTQHVRHTTKKGGSMDVGYQGSKASANLSKEKELAWDQERFDEASTDQLFNTVTGRPNGLSWFIKQNPLQNHGLMPEFWAAVLVRRASQERYTVRFTMEASSGKKDNAVITVKDYLGLEQDGSTFGVTPKPGQIVVCNGEGEDIRQSVDPNHLGQLMDPEMNTRLTVTWGPQHNNEASTAPNPATSRVAETPTGGGSAEGVQAAREKMQLGATALVGGAPAWIPGGRPALPAQVPRDVPATTNPLLSRQPRLGEVAEEVGGDMVPLLMTWGNPHATAAGTGIDSARLVSLEARAAQIEARLAAQDVMIMQLQQALAAKDTEPKIPGQPHEGAGIGYR